MLTREEKGKIIEDVRKNIQDARAVFLTNLIGVSSNDAVAIRKGVRDANGKVVITRNTLFRIAAEGTAAEKMMSELKGPHAVAFAYEDAAAVAKCIKDAAKEHEEIISFKGALLNGEELSLDQVKQLADLPSREEMLGTLLATFMAPISAFARVMNSIKEQKEEGGEAAPAETAEAAAPTEETKTEE